MQALALGQGTVQNQQRQTRMTSTNEATNRRLSMNLKGSLGAEDEFGDPFARHQNVKNGK
jgi:hypothetical protein